MTCSQSPRRAISQGGWRTIHYRHHCGCMFKRRSALTALTTSFTVDILNLKGGARMSKRYAVRFTLHSRYSTGYHGFRAVNDQSVINSIFTVAGYTYGRCLDCTHSDYSLIGCERQVSPLITILSPIICYFLSKYSQEIFNGYRFGFELLMVNGFFTFMGLLAVSNRNRRVLHS